MGRLRDINRDGKVNFGDTWLGDLVGFDGSLGVQGDSLKDSLMGSRRRSVEELAGDYVESRARTVGAEQRALAPKTSKRPEPKPARGASEETKKALGLDKPVMTEAPEGLGKPSDFSVQKPRDLPAESARDAYERMRVAQRSGAATGGAGGKPPDYHVPMPEAPDRSGLLQRPAVPEVRPKPTPDGTVRMNPDRAAEVEARIRQ